MLSLPDRDLTGRDPDLPGLSTLLDPEGIEALIEKEWPEVTAAAAEIFYLRYKPQTSCLAGYRVQLNGKPTILAIRARRADAADKIANHLRKASVSGTLGTGRTVLRDALTLAVYPNDHRLPALTCVGDRHRRAELLADVGFGPESELALLRYRPERRFVGKLTDPSGKCASVKLYRDGDYEQALANAWALRSDGPLSLPVVHGWSDRFNAIACSWVEGPPLSPSLASAERIGQALSRLHFQRPQSLKKIEPATQARSVLMLAQHVARLWPPLAKQAQRVARHISRELDDDPGSQAALHGDFHLDQLIDAGDAVGIVDLDEAGFGAAEWDLGNIAGHLHVRQLDVCPDQARSFSEALCDAYRASGGRASVEQVRLQTAHSIFRLAARPFRDRESDWPERIERILVLSEGIGGWPRRAISLPQKGDPALPHLGEACDPHLALGHLDLTALGPGDWRIRSAQLMRHKIGRRCVIEYELAEPSGSHEVLIGKMRARGPDTRCFALQSELWRTRFGPRTVDGISVPEPVALVPQLSMWLQRKVQGLPFGFGPGRASLEPRRVAEAIAKLHRSNVAPVRRHGIADEIRILRERFEALIERRPDWRVRLEQLLESAGQLCLLAVPTRMRPIHRDFYQDHLIVDGNAICIVDFDLLCLGDPAVDIGNFSAHLTELALRTQGDPERPGLWQQALKREYCRLGEAAPFNIELYELLTLMRLVEIADRMVERRASAERLLHHVEQRVSMLTNASRKTCDA